MWESDDISDLHFQCSINMLFKSCCVVSNSYKNILNFKQLFTKQKSLNRIKIKIPPILNLDDTIIISTSTNKIINENFKCELR